MDYFFIHFSCIFVIINGESMALALDVWVFVENLSAFLQKVFIVASDRSLMVLQTRTIIIFIFACVFLGGHECYGCQFQCCVIFSLWLGIVRAESSCFVLLPQILFFFLFEFSLPIEGTDFRKTCLGSLCFTLPQWSP